MVERTFTNVPPGQSITLISTGLGGTDTPDPSAPIDNLGFDPQFRNCLYIGSAVVDGGGQNIVAIVNQARLGATKQSSAYEASPLLRLRSKPARHWLRLATSVY